MGPGAGAPSVTGAAAVPVSATTAGAAPALLEISSVAARSPVPWGAKWIVALQLDAGATSPPHVCEPTKKSPGSSPPKLRPEMISGADPWLVIVTVRGAVVAPNASEAVLSIAVGTG